ncbi:type VI secretion system accessory protein TagJ [Sandaracinobacteroides saxicola]|uniref:Virulence protein SciE type n=1 Tax=Sandaracinobacteroides saxicola TaxID=2759707 RepID=A0A7G5IJ08_9SPHN|nr:type VI secretion system accessory protein TagJ [Sandaracinobacteroides saxicola]QMW23350.1 virulence protein SciE type [Sandaracinobacteroides saxicola]
MDAEALLKSGDLVGARASLAELLRREPGNAKARQFFWQLIAVAGEWEKAGTQLRALSSAEPKAMMLASVYNQALAAMLVRDAVFEGKAKPVSLVGQEPWVEGLLDALHAQVMLLPDAAARQAAALEAAPASEGRLNGEEFAWIADADARFGPMLEVIIGDKYGFIPFAALKRVKAKEPEDLRDFVWQAVDLELRSGQTSAALAPVTYPGTRAAGKPALMLARGTEWLAQGEAELGLGQHLLATDSADIGLLELRELIIA